MPSHHRANPGDGEQQNKEVVTLPTLEVERTFWRSGGVRVVGVDEAGRGPLAGPVVAAACLIPKNCHMIDGVRDSKLLSRERREALFEEIRAQAPAIGVGAASVSVIELRNILNATHLAMRRALARVGEYDHALIDGLPAKGIPGPHTAIVDGDARCYAIACASIIAKVTRDRLMCRLAARYPNYGWDHNAGYSTPEHVAALNRFGLSPHHRRTYAPVRALIEGRED